MKTNASSIQRLITALLLVAAALATGCSTFHRDWKTALSEPAPVTGLEGPWEGKWLSEVNGHKGRLRCLMEPRSERQYQARFHAKYWKIFSHGSTVMLDVRPANGRYEFQGEANLGRLAGGVYSYRGEAGSTNFFSTYRSKYDHGTFQMTRPERQK